jgi:hypothetical protein
MRADDRVALEQLRSFSNVDAVHTVFYYLYFPNEQGAMDVSRILRDQGFAVEQRMSADEINWLVLATNRVLPTEAAISAMCEHLERVAIEHQGRFDGWEAEVQHE